MSLAIFSLCARFLLWVCGAELIAKGPRARMYIAPLWLAGTMQGTRAVTFGRCILFASRVEFANPQVRRHEMIHVGQFERDGALVFVFRYFAQYGELRGRGLAPDDAYRTIDYEAEAYRNQADPTLTIEP